MSAMGELFLAYKIFEVFTRHDFVDFFFHSGYYYFKRSTQSTSRIGWIMFNIGYVLCRWAGLC